MVAACAGRGDDLNAGSASVVGVAGSTSRVDGSDSPAPDRRRWLADLDVVYDEWLRIPGSGAAPVQRTLTYHVIESATEVPIDFVYEETDAEFGIRFSVAGNVRSIEN
jgi:hypothetical protein